MHRFYCHSLPPAHPLEPGSALPDALARLDPDEAHHARRVLRLQLGDEVGVFDGQGHVGRGTLVSWDAGATVKLTELSRVERPTPLLTVASAIPKGDRAEDMVNQLSQLGVDRFVPLRTARGVVDPRPRKLDKFERISVESAKQCGRAYLMKVEPQAELAAVLDEQHDVRLIASPASGPIASLTDRLRAAGSVLVLIGPEGGWTDDELTMAARAGCEPWSLGPHILRIETAATAAAAIIRHAAGRH